MEYAHVVSPHWHWHWIVPFLLMTLMFMFATRMCRRMSAWQRGVERYGRGRLDCWEPGHGPMADEWSEPPVRILDRRYASGEISREEYEQMRRDVESSSPDAGSGDDA